MALRPIKLDYLPEHVEALLEEIDTNEKRIAELDMALRNVLDEWEPLRDAYRSDRKGDRQFAIAKAIYENALVALNGPRPKE